MKKLVFAFVAMAAMSFAFTTTSCNKGGAADTDTVKAEPTDTVRDTIRTAEGVDSLIIVTCGEQVDTIVVEAPAENAEAPAEEKTAE